MTGESPNPKIKNNAIEHPLEESFINIVGKTRNIPFTCLSAFQLFLVIKWPRGFFTT